MNRLFLFSLLLMGSAYAQTTKKVCFLGNSYTYVNDMPGIISSIATADGNTLIKDQYTPGGYTLEGHSTNTFSFAAMANDTWDYVVLQDQSQLPSFPWGQVKTDVLPYAKVLCDSIRSANSCAVPLFYNTWGRRDGDSQWDSINTFDKMNQRLFNAYGYMADQNSGKRAPIGAGFNHVHDDIASPMTHFDLYQTDGSHPSIYGSYLAACIFYEVVFEESSQGNTYLPVGVTAGEATYLQDVANHILNDLDSVETDFTDPFASFSYSTNGSDITFINESEHSFEWSWDFGDSNNSTVENPVHSYGTNGSYSVTLTASYCGISSDTTILINLSAGIEIPIQPSIMMFPNPAHDFLFISYEGQDEFAQLYSLEGRYIGDIPLNLKYELKTIPGTYLVKIGASIERLIIE